MSRLLGALDQYHVTPDPWPQERKERMKECTKLPYSGSGVAMIHSLPKSSSLFLYENSNFVWSFSKRDITIWSLIYIAHSISGKSCISPVCELRFQDIYKLHSRDLCFQNGCWPSVQNIESKPFQFNMVVTMFFCSLIVSGKTNFPQKLSRLTSNVYAYTHTHTRTWQVFDGTGTCMNTCQWSTAHTVKVITVHWGSVGCLQPTSPFEWFLKTRTLFHRSLSEMQLVCTVT